MRKNKRGQMANALNSLVVLGVGLFIVGIVMSFLALVNTNIRTSLAGNPDAELVVNQSIAAGQQVTTFLSPVALVGVAIVIIGLIVGGIGLRNALS